MQIPEMMITARSGAPHAAPETMFSELVSIYLRRCAAAMAETRSAQMEAFTVGPDCGDNLSRRVWRMLGAFDERYAVRSVYIYPPCGSVTCSMVSRSVCRVTVSGPAVGGLADRHSKAHVITKTDHIAVKPCQSPDEAH